MRCNVIWLSPATDQLAAVWLAADDPPAVTAASDRIDAMLRSDPLAAGEGLTPPDRVLFVPPLGVVFTVDEADRVVWVSSCGLSRRPRP